MRVPTVSIIIPSAGTGGQVWGDYRIHLLACLQSIVERSSFADFEVVVVADATMPLPVRRDAARLARERLVIVDFDEEFNFSRKVNSGALAARGSHMIFLNDDTMVISEDWIERLLEPLRQPNVAMVGGLLLFPDRTIQHAGVSLDDAPHHIGFRMALEQAERDAELMSVREVSGVTAACALVRREVFLEVGGFATRFPANFNDVDFALKVRHRGHRVMWTPHARLWHVESASRDPAVSPIELERLFARWGHRIGADPYRQRT